MNQAIFKGSAKQLDELETLVSNAMHFAANRLREGRAVTTVDGPYVKQDEDELFFVVNLKEEKNERRETE